MVVQNHSKYHGGGICCIVIYYGTTLLFYVGMRFELEYNNNLYCNLTQISSHHKIPILYNLISSQTYILLSNQSTAPEIHHNNQEIFKLIILVDFTLNEFHCHNSGKYWLNSFSTAFKCHGKPYL